jgi:hypothetical protein
MNRFLASAMPLLLAAAPHIRAEWITESFQLKAGWNAIYPLIDASHSTLDFQLAAYPGVQEVWRWQPERVDPAHPGNPELAPTGLEWSVWKAGLPEETSFDQIHANHGYLVKVADGTPTFTFALKGRPAIPEVRWRGDGIHLAGFPVLATGTTPTFANYLAPTGFALAEAEILRYNGGPINAGTNPLAVNPTVSRITRGQAYWIRVKEFSRYYGPVSVALDAGKEVRFNRRSDVSRMVLKNQTSVALTVTLGSTASETPPNGQPAIAGRLPLLAQVDAETEFAPLGTRTITIAAGAVAQVRLLPDRTNMSNVVGARFAALLHLKTTGGVTGQEMFIPATAEVASPAGLWIGEAQITQVGSLVRRFQRDAEGNNVTDGDGNPVMIEDLTTPGGATELPEVSPPYTLRLIVHVDASGQARLLSHVFQGKLAAAPPDEPIGLALLESQLDAAALDQATRLSVAHLPLDTVLSVNGVFAPGGSLAGSGDLVTPHTSPENPFLHVYHPDHDNLDARFQQTLPPGRESFEIRRQINLDFEQSRPDGLPTSWGATLISGIYQENILGTTRPGSSLRVRGPFVLHKVSDIAVLTGL